MGKQIQGLSLLMLTSALVVILLQSACVESEIQPTLSLEEIGTLVAETLAAEPVDTLSLEEIGTLVAETLAAESFETQTAIAVPSSTPVASPTATLVPTATLTPTITPSPSVTLPSFLGAGCIPAGTKREVGSVTAITDGDTIRVSINGVEQTVRYIGIDTPERGQPYFSETTNKNSSLVRGQTVTLVKDVSETDQFSRIVRYVLVENTFVNYQLVRTGYAFASTNPPDVACSTTFIQAQSQARTAGSGMWQTTPTPGCDPSYPDFCIPPPPPDLDCGDIGRNNFTVRPPDPHRFDGDFDGVGCEVSAPPPAPTSPPPTGNCHPSYPDVCIPPPPPDLDCGEISYRRFRVVGSDPHGFDGDNDGIGCESG